MNRITQFTLISLVWAITTTVFAQTIPLPEHPRPDFERSNWQNLNGDWQFEYDSLNKGLTEKWFNGSTAFSKQIHVPFPWGSPLSGVADQADIGWYKREITVNPSWKNQRTFLTVGASDWETTVWLDGQLLGTHRGGYTPFSFELTPYLKYGTAQQVIIRADDKRRDFTLYGKQGYGDARGIWQTIYIESRGHNYAENIHFRPDIDLQCVFASVELGDFADHELDVQITLHTPGGEVTGMAHIAKGHDRGSVRIDLKNPRLWTLEDPYLYDAEVRVDDDVVRSYFGMRKISVAPLPDSGIPYVALNNKPIYLQLALDQSYHPGGYYTFPSDAFMKSEIEKAKSIGLNGIRTHIKVDFPRKLYWADRLGLLIMSDLPNSWGDPEAKMQGEAENTLRAMIARDYNHPAIFSWILFNETWGLRTSVENGKTVNRVYLPKTQKWVVSMYYLAKSLDDTRLVEDNSICCGAGHTVTDLNSFHDYRAGWEWETVLKQLSDSSYEGSTTQFEPGYVQGKQPKINSECGNVWGYEGSTGDVDWSWDYHRMMNTFRMFPKIAGWLYTEHHDVINEWNGYWRFDRSNKFTGVDELALGMTLNDFHSPIYLSTGNSICKTVKTGESVSVPLYLSSMSSQNIGSSVTISWGLRLTNTLGIESSVSTGTRSVPYHPYIQSRLEDLVIRIPDTPGLAILTLQVTDAGGHTLHRNFTHFEVEGESKIPKTKIFPVAAKAFRHGEWSLKQWNVLDGQKVCGAGRGYFEYSIPVEKNLDPNSVREAYFLVEISAKQLFDKDREKMATTNLDYMLGAKASPHINPNSYPMTDEQKFPSTIRMTVNGESVSIVTLADDPADHRGVLSWHHQLQDKKLREAGSYGYLTKVPVTKAQLSKARASGELVIRMATEGDGGLAVYDKGFGRYPLGPELVVISK